MMPHITQAVSGFMPNPGQFKWPHLESLLRFGDGVFRCCVGGVLRVGDADVALRVGDGILQFFAFPRW